MAELIKRSTVIDVLKETGIIHDNDLGHLIVEEIERMPTTTEAEIRAKAIEDMVEGIRDILICNSIYNIDCITTLAEQLKENEDGK